MFILLKNTVCLTNTGTWGNKEIEYLCCELTESVSSVLSSAVDLLLDLGQVISPLSSTAECCFSSYSSALSAYAEYSPDLFFLLWMAGAEQRESLVMATVLKMVPKSLKSELPWGQLEAGVGLVQTDAHLERCCPRGSEFLAQVSIAGTGAMHASACLSNREFHPCRWQGNARQYAVFKRLISVQMSWLKYFCKVKGAWSLMITDVIAQRHHILRAITCTAQGGQCAKSSLRWEATPGYPCESSIPHPSCSGDTVRNSRACTPCQERDV